MSAVVQCGRCGYQLVPLETARRELVPVAWGAIEGYVCADARDCERRERDRVAGPALAELEASRCAPLYTFGYDYGESFWGDPWAPPP